MRKILFLMFAWVLTISVMNAQAVHESKLFDNIYSTVSVGATNKTTGWDNNNIRPNIGFEIGKHLTTLYATGVEIRGNINTKGVKTAFDEMRLSWMHKVNIGNLIAGYDIHRKWHAQLVGGLGWGHDMVTRDDYGVFNTGVEVNYDLNRSWSLIAKPQIEWARVNHGLNVNNSNIGLSVGIRYNFKNTDGSRGFQVCAESVLIEELNQLRAENDELNMLLEKYSATNHLLYDQLEDLKKHKCKVDTIIINKMIANSIGFERNSSKLTKSSYPFLYQIAQNYDKVIVNGYADANTGTPDYNMTLSKNRAEAVKKVLLEYGMKEVIIKAYGDTKQEFKDNDLNRVVIIKEAE